MSRISWCALLLSLVAMSVSQGARAEPPPPSSARAPDRDAVGRGRLGPVRQGIDPLDRTGDDCCGLDAKILAARFGHAILSHVGRELAVVTARMPGLPPEPAVLGEALALAKAGERAAVADAARARGLVVLREVASIDLLVLSRPGADPAALAAEVAKIPGVRHAAPNWVARCAFTPNDVLFKQQEGLRGLGAEAAWDLSRGRGVTIAVLDSGVDAEHPDLSGAISGFLDVIDIPPSVEPFDDCGHGTAIAGLIAARADDGIGTAGIAPEAQILAIKVADRNGHASFGDLAAGLEEALSRGARIINMSLGAFVDDPVLDAAISRAIAAGVLVVASAGNENVDSIEFPAALPGVLAVGGSSPAGELAYRTALGPTIGLLAPAEGILAPLPGNVWGYVRGTSASAAFTSGVAALRLSREPGLSGAALAQALREAVRPVAVFAGARELYDFGALDASLAALRSSEPRPVRTLKNVIAPPSPSGLYIPRFVARPDFATRAVVAEALIRNAGQSAENGLIVDFAIDGQVFATREVGSIPAGGAARIEAPWPFPTREAPEKAQFSVAVRARGEAASSALVRIGETAEHPVSVLYQQSNDIDIIADAPWRVADGRPYVPVLLFVPSKSDPTTATFLDFSDAKILEQDTPDASAATTLLYEDATGKTPTTVAAGIEPEDENFNIPSLPSGAQDLRLFQGENLTLDGRHMVLRIPRATLGVAASPAPGTMKFLDVRLAWGFHRMIGGVFNTTRTGTTNKMLGVEFGPALPVLSGVDGHYYDAHHHTIAEWYFSSWTDLFAPRKAYGGPVLMTAETAYAIGMIDSVSSLPGLVTISDHNCFYNDFGPSNDPTRRPPYGPTSPAQSLGANGQVLSEHERYRQIFGVSSGEEIAFDQNQTYNIPSGVGTVGIPIGAHMISYRGEHVEGPWTGGGWIPDPSAPPGLNVELDGVLRQWATQNQAANATSFIFAAHPFSGQGFTDQNLTLALGLDPTNRTLDHVHASPAGFVFKGLQLWNGRGNHSVPASKIDFNDLNPYIDSNWIAGDSGWDGDLEQGLTFWHRAISTLLDYSFNADPDGVFVRKAFIAGGSDAHGDYCYDISRLATPILMQSTYSVGSSYYGCARTYVLGDGQQGATPGDRYMNAFSAGRSTITDGPLLAFTMDAEGRWDSAHLRWHDQTNVPEDDDGRMGGGDAFDGTGTMLVVNGAPNVFYRYQYDNSADFGSAQGAIAAIKIYKDELGVQAQTRQRNGIDEVLSRGSLPLGGTGVPLVAQVDPAAEGLVTRPCAYSLAAFTGSDPEVTPLGADEHRCYTNPVWALPVDVSVQVTIPTAAAQIDADNLTVTFRFPVSMDGQPVSIELKSLDSNGDSSDASQPGFPLQMVQWSNAGGSRNSLLIMTNAAPIALGGASYPATGSTSFVVYFRAPPKDQFGNALNSVATTFSVAQPPGIAGTTSSPSIAGTGNGGGGGGGGGGCAMGPASGSPAAFAPWASLVLLLVAVRRARAVRWIA